MGGDGAHSQSIVDEEKPVVVLPTQLDGMNCSGSRDLRRWGGWMEELWISD